MQETNSLFDAKYYETGLGSPYERNAHWLGFFGTVAEESIRALKPKSVLDVGCAFGFLVESFWDRGVEAYGFDVSEFAISQVRRDIQKYCRQASILEPIEGRYDLVTCIEVLEHLQPEQTEAAIANIAAATDVILFSSTPRDLSEATHFNVRPVIGWLNLFKNVGFWPDCVFDADFVAPHAILLRKQAPLAEDSLVLISEKVRWKCEFLERVRQIGIFQTRISALEAGDGETGLLAEIDTLRGELASVSGEFTHWREADEHQSTQHQLTLAKAQADNTQLLHQLDVLRSQCAQLSNQVAEGQQREAADLAERNKILAAASKSKTESESLQKGLAEKQIVLDLAASQIAKSERERDRLKDELASTVSLLSSSVYDVARIQSGQHLASFSGLVSKGIGQAWLILKLRRSAARKKYQQLTEQIGLIAESQLFDAAWYLKTYPDVAAAGINPVLHYLENGAQEKRNPSPRFDSCWYLDQYPDVAAAGLNPLIHYVEFGAPEGRQSRPVSEIAAIGEDGSDFSLIADSPLFDIAWYLENYPEVAAGKLDAISHYVQIGALEKRNPGPRFDAARYLERYPDVAEARLNPLAHFLAFGMKEGREIHPVVRQHAPPDGEARRQYELIAASPLFDKDWYTMTYPAVVAAGLDPILHFLEHGTSGELNPGPKFDANWYLALHRDVANAKLNPLLHYLDHGAAENRSTRPIADRRDVDLLLETQFPDVTPLELFYLPRSTRRVTIVANSINTGLLYGGVGTALMFGTLLAKNLEAGLRLVTRQEPPAGGNFGDILKTNGIEWNNDIELVSAPFGGGREIAVSDADVFLTTSWWTTKGVRRTVHPSKIFYLLQEDERMFYPFGDRRLRCEETIQDPTIRFIINTKLLFEHMTSGPDAFNSIRDHGTWFEPAFPEANYYPDRKANGTGKKQFFFYARPNNTRNLYWRGLEVIRAAIERGILRSDEWDLNFVGNEVEPVVFLGNPVIKNHQNLRWSDYASLVRKMDLGLCLMDTPHPSYPPLDLAASGAVVVTNKRGLKTSLAQYSENILCADSDVEELTSALAKGVALAGDEEVRYANYSRNGLLRDWNVALQPAVAQLAGIIRAEGS